jgi:hypothetical protein
VEKFMTSQQIADVMLIAYRADRIAIQRIAAIDAMFESATDWGSWMVMVANERRTLVTHLNDHGHEIPHRHQAHCDQAGPAEAA